MCSLLLGIRAGREAVTKPGSATSLTVIEKVLQAL